MPAHHLGRPGKTLSVYIIRCKNSLQGIPLFAKAKHILGVVIAGGLFVCQLAGPLYPSVRSGTLAYTFILGIAGSPLVGFIAPVVPTCRTDVFAQLAADEHCCRIRAPRPAQIHLVHSRRCCQPAVAEDIAHGYILRSGSGSDIRVSFAVDGAILE